jgi:hypothetical protein
MRQDAKADIILGKALSVLPETKLFEPVAICCIGGPSWI